MIKVVTLEATQYHASEHYRTEGPLRRMADDGLIEFFRIPLDDFQDLVYLSEFDIFYFWNPAHYAAEHLVTAAKAAGLAIWVDYDDHFEQVPLYHPLHADVSMHELKKRYTAFLQVADAVSVTTEVLYHQARQYNDNVHHIPNALPSTITPMHREQHDPIRVIYRGSPRHLEDVREVREGFVDSEKLEYTFFWLLPYFLEGILPRWHYFGRSKLQTYLKNLHEVQPDWVIVPMIDNTFNKAVSNIAWLEATWAGAAVLAPSYLPEFNASTFPIFNYKNADQMRGSLKAMAAGELNTIRQVLIRESVKRINKDLILESTNKKRYNLCTQLVTDSSSASSANSPTTLQGNAS